jgi:phosphoribosylformimino-5-aminoimidazole carboxamide ribotide isomerase
VPVAVGLDHRDGELAVHGWTEGSGVRLDDALGRFPTGVAAFVITDIGRDGMLRGPDVDGLAAALAATERSR